MKNSKGANKPLRPEEHPMYHNTWKLLRCYRDVVWSLELAVQQVKIKFQLEYGESLDDFIDGMYLAGVDLSGTDIESHARTIERSRKMLSIVDSSVQLLRTKHKNGEDYYWLLYYAYLSPQQITKTEEIVEQLAPHIKYISASTYFRRKKDAVYALSTILWGFNTKDMLGVVEQFVPLIDDNSTI